MAVFFNQQKGGSILNNLDKNTIQSDNIISQPPQQLKSESLSIKEIKKDPELKKDAHRLLAKAISLQNEDRSPVEAGKNCILAIQIDPTNLNARLNVALCLQKLGPL